MVKLDFLEDELIERMERARKNVSKLVKYRGAGDLMKMYNNLEGIRSELSYESIECRRLHKPTPKFIEVYDRFKTQLKDLEKMLTFAAIKFKNTENR